ncbi:MAG: hypothetical protein PSX36_05990 [bacterium]|nr:hypothetical protein [bacterium]
MARIIIHKNVSPDELHEQRLRDDFKLSHEERMKKAFKLMRLGLLFSQRSKAGFGKKIIINGTDGRV